MAWFTFSCAGAPAAPSARECHTVQAVDNVLLFFGGNDDKGRMNDVHALNTDTMQWRLLEPTPDSEVPSKRSAHAATMLDGRYMYIFGGWDGSHELGDLHRFDIYTQKWELVRTTGTGPIPRHFHNSVIVGRRLFVLAGYDGRNWCNDVAVINLDTAEWEHISMAEGAMPGPRASGACCVVDDDKILLFGGYDGVEFLDDLWILHTRDPHTRQPAYRWERVGPPAPAENDPHPWPQPRSGHAIESIGNVVLSFGGRFRSGRYNDVSMFNYSTRTWHKVNTVGEAFKPRKTHAVAHVGHRIFLHGGHDGERWMGDVVHVLDATSILQAVIPNLRIHVPHAPVRTNFAQLLPHTFRDAQHDDMCAKTTHGGDAWIADDAPGRLASQLSLHLFSHGTAAAAAVQPCVVPACEWSNDVSVGADDALRSESALACATSVYNVVTLGEWPPCLHPHNSSARASRARSMDAACLNPAAGGAVCAAAEQAAGRSVVQLVCPYCDMRTSGAAARSATTSAQGSHTAASGHHVPSTALLPMLHSAFQTPASRHTLPSHTGSARSASVAMHSGRTRGSAEYRSAHEAAGVQDAPHAVESLSYEAASAHSGRRRGGVRTSGSCGAPAGSMRSENYGDNTRGGVASASYRCEGGAASPTTEHSGVAAGGEMSAMLPHAGETPRPPRRVSKEGGLPLVWTADPDTFADVTLVVQGVPLHLHRAILAARSEYFRAMFSLPLTEARSRCIELPGVTLDVFRIIVRYLYLNERPGLADMRSKCLDILQQAQMMGVISLSLLCQRYLEGLLKPSNAAAMLEAADYHQATPLRRVCVQYILDRFTTVCDNFGLSMLRADLLREVMQRRAQGKTGASAGSATFVSAGAHVDASWPGLNVPCDGSVQSADAMAAVSSAQKMRALVAGLPIMSLTSPTIDAWPSPHASVDARAGDLSPPSAAPSLRPLIFDAEVDPQTASDALMPAAAHAAAAGGTPITNGVPTALARASASALGGAPASSMPSTPQVALARYGTTGDAASAGVSASSVTTVAVAAAVDTLHAAQAALPAPVTGVKRRFAVLSAGQVEQATPLAVGVSGDAGAERSSRVRRRVGSHHTALDVVRVVSVTDEEHEVGEEEREEEDGHGGGYESCASANRWNAADEHDTSTSAVLSSAALRSAARIIGVAHNATSGNSSSGSMLSPSLSTVTVPLAVSGGGGGATDAAVRASLRTEVVAASEEADRTFALRSASLSAAVRTLPAHAASDAADADTMAVGGLAGSQQLGPSSATPALLPTEHSAGSQELGMQSPFTPHDTERGVGHGSASVAAGVTASQSSAALGLLDSQGTAGTPHAAEPRALFMAAAGGDVVHVVAGSANSADDAASGSHVALEEPSSRAVAESSQASRPSGAA